MFCLSFTYFCSLFPPSLLMFIRRLFFGKRRAVTFFSLLCVFMQALLEKFLTLHPGKHVLLDGFPRSLDNARDWARLFGPPEACIRYTVHSIIAYTKPPFLGL